MQQPRTEGVAVDRVDRRRLLAGQRRRRQRSGEPGSAPGPPLGRLHTLEPGWQGLQQDFAQRRLIVGARKPAKLHEISRQWRKVAQNGPSRLELGGRHFAGGNDLDDDADPFPATERHTYPETRIGGTALLAQVVEESMQRQVEGNAQDGHWRQGVRDRGRQAHDPDRVFCRLGKPVDNAVDYWTGNRPNTGKSMLWRSNRNHTDTHKLFIFNGLQ